MKVLVVGSGGREHALAWKLSESQSVSEVHCAPGNPGMLKVGTCHDVSAEDIDGLLDLSRELNFDLVVVGPEAPLAMGLADSLRQSGVTVFGPGRTGAQLETSKAWAKEFMARHGIPTAQYKAVSSLSEGMSYLESHPGPIVIKASGLAAGKGVTVASSQSEAEAALRDCFEADVFGAAGHTVVIEECLYGEEVSVFAVTDGTAWTLLPSSQDHKRAYDGDLGPNTGGMGAYSPAPVLSPAVLSEVIGRILEPTLKGLREEGIDYRGVLYMGLILTASGPHVIEYNVRFGDPETQAVLPRVDGDLGHWFLTAGKGSLRAPRTAPEHPGACICVVAAAEGYPGSYEKNLPIVGVDSAEQSDAHVFHAGTSIHEQQLVSSGGRVLSVVARGASLLQASQTAYSALEQIEFKGMWFRKDIGHKAL